MSSALPSTMILLSTRGTGPALVFCPDVGGNVIYARMLVEALGAGPSSYGFRLAPDMLDSLATLTLEGAARRFASDLVASGIGRPLHLVGYSLASYMAAETARQLTLLGHPPDRLWIIDTTARRKLTLRSLVKYAMSRLSTRRADILHRLGFISFDLSCHPEGYRPIIRRFYELFSRYQPRQWNGAATVVVAHDSATRRLPPDLGWGRYITMGVDSVTVPGDHLSMMRDIQNAAVLARRILDQFRSDAAPMLIFPDPNRL